MLKCSRFIFFSSPDGCFYCEWPKNENCGKIEETKGLSSIKVGQAATFTIDAFPKNKYVGVVDEISPVSVDSGVIFSISDKDL